MNYPEKKVISNILAVCRRNLPSFSPVDLEKDELAIVGGSPSIINYLDEIKDKEIMALNGVYNFLLNKDIISEYLVIMDARPINHKFVSRPDRSTTFLIASQCDPKIFSKLNGYDVVTWHADAPYFPKLKNDHEVIAGGRTVASRALILAYLMGYKKIYLYGMDSSYNTLHHAYEQKQNDHLKTIEVMGFTTNDILVEQVKCLQDLQVRLKEKGVEVVCRSEGFYKAANEACQIQ